MDDKIMEKPSKILTKYWLYAERGSGLYPPSTPNSGKWLIFVSIDQIDKYWEIIKRATVTGKLGNVTKVSTARRNPTARDNDTKVICVYTYDYTDMKDVLHIREVLLGLGFTQRLVYKTDQTTRDGQYSKKGTTVGKYYR